MSESRMIRGTIILSIATFLSKFLGMLFVIPFNAIVGDKGGYLYSYSYTPYTIILSLSTVGVPLAVSKFVSKYNAIGDYRTGRVLFRSGMLIMTITGAIGFLVMYYGAPALASLTLGSEGKDADYQSLVFTMRVLSFALLFVPPMSLMRGYFQGFQSMGPTAASQTIEQIVRIAFGLIGAYVVVDILNFPERVAVRDAVALVNFGAFVGALAGLVNLIHYWFKRKRYMDEKVAASPPVPAMKLGAMYRELIGYAIPFVCVGLANQLYLLIDQFTLNHFLKLFYDYSTNRLHAIVSNLMMYDQKLIMIPVSLATALAVSVVPAITASFVKGDHHEMRIEITKALQFVIFFTLPAAGGLSILAYEVYALLYGFDEGIRIGGEILRWYAPSAILFAGFSVTAAILQGINIQKVTILSLSVGILIKMIFNPVFIKWWNMTGPILATDLGYVVSIIINLLAIREITGYRFGFIGKRFLLISIFTALMGVAIFVPSWLFGGLIPATRWESLVMSVFGMVLGAAVYLLLALRSGLARQVLGRNVPVLKRFM